MEILTIFVCGILVGALGAFLGIGGGIIIVPLLAIGFGYPVHDAVATSLAVIVANSIIIAKQHLSPPVAVPGAKGAANLRIGLFIALFSVSGALVGSIISLGVSAGTLYIVLGLSQMLTVMLMLVKSRLKGQFYNAEKRGYFSSVYYDVQRGSDIQYRMYNPAPSVLVSLFSGVLSGMVGIGGGVMVVPALNIFSGIPMKVATATSVVIMGFTAASGGLMFYLSGYTNIMTVMIMVPALYLGSRAAVAAAKRVSNETVYKAFTVFLFLIACHMLYRGFTY